MGSNHGNLFNELNILVRGRYGVLHVIMNRTRLGTGDGDMNTSGVVYSECDETGKAGVGRRRKCRVEDTGKGWVVKSS